MPGLSIGEVAVDWLGHSAFRVKDAGLTVYLDPYQLPRGLEPADLILVTHEHFDHCSPQDLAALRKDDTKVVAPAVAASCASRGGEVVEISPGSIIEVRGVRIRGVPAYNVNKFRSPGRVFHPKEDGRVGFVLEIGGVKIYHAGDTDNIPEMAELAGLGIDVALLPVSGVYVMTPEEAVEAVKTIKPKMAVPMHYGAIVGSMREAERFKELASSITEVVVLEKLA